MVNKKPTLFKRKEQDIPKTASYNVQQIIALKGSNVPATSKERSGEIKADARYAAREQLLEKSQTQHDFNFEYKAPNPLLEPTEDELDEIIDNTIDEVTIKQQKRDKVAAAADKRVRRHFTMTPTADPRNVAHNYLPDYTSCDADMDDVFLKK